MKESITGLRLKIPREYFVLCRMATKGQPCKLRLFGELGEEPPSGRYKVWGKEGTSV